MPLLVGPPKATEGIRQGDLLRVDALYKAGPEGQPNKCRGVELALVISRDCASAHKEQILVASVRAAPKQPLVTAGELEAAAGDWNKQAEIFRSLVQALSEKRDGGLTPDRVYLGSLPESNDRLVAMLDEISPLELPLEQEERDAWVSDRRVGQLAPDALRALPTRLYWALCRTGFDDQEWLADPDLRAVVDAGEAAHAAAQQAVSSLKLKLGSKQQEGAHDKELENYERELKNLEREVKSLFELVEPYQRERQRRRAATDPAIESSG